jgi:hypothetical protein
MEQHVRPIQLPVFELRLGKVEIGHIVGRIESTIDGDVLSELIVVATLRPSGGKREVGGGIVGALVLAAVKKFDGPAGVALFEFSMGECLVKPKSIRGCLAAR